MIDASPATLVAAWERAAELPPAERGRALLGLDPSGGEVDCWTLGGRDAALARIFADLYGEFVEATLSCCACGALLEFQTTIAALFGTAVADPEPAAFALHTGAYELLLRPIRLADVVGLPPSAERARDRILRRCVLEARRAGRAADVGSFSTDVCAAISEALCGADPSSEILVTLACAGCGVENRIPFDIGTFLWEAIERSAAQLLLDVHVLAGAYGWSERDILALAPQRRRRYLELIAG